MVSPDNLVNSTIASLTEGGVASYTVRLDVELDIIPLASVISMRTGYVPAEISRVPISKLRLDIPCF